MSTNDVTLTISLLNGESCSISTSLEATLGDVKAKISKEMGHPPLRQRLSAVECTDYVEKCSSLFLKIIDCIKNNASGKKRKGVISEKNKKLCLLTRTCLSGPVLDRPWRGPGLLDMSKF